MTTYHCRIASGKAAATVLRHLDALGTVAADHLREADCFISVVLTDAEIGEFEVQYAADSEIAELAA